MRSVPWKGRAAALALAACSAVSAVSTVSAQTLYKCGNTYSQAPCAYQARPAKINPDAQPAAPAAPHGSELCRLAVVSAVGLPENMPVIDRVADPVAELLRIGEQPIESRRIDVFVNARVAAATSPYRCYLSVDQKRLLRLVGPSGH
jgi:hypothetical protein